MPAARPGAPRPVGPPSRAAQLHPGEGTGRPGRSCAGLRGVPARQRIEAQAGEMGRRGGTPARGCDPAHVRQRHAHAAGCPARPRNHPDRQPPAFRFHPGRADPGLASGGRGRQRDQGSAAGHRRGNTAPRRGFPALGTRCDRAGLAAPRQRIPCANRALAQNQTTLHRQEPDELVSGRRGAGDVAGGARGHRLARSGGDLSGVLPAMLHRRRRVRLRPRRAGRLLHRLPAP